MPNNLPRGFSDKEPQNNRRPQSSVDALELFVRRRFRWSVVFVTVTAVGVCVIHERAYWANAFMWCVAFLSVGAFGGLLFAAPGARPRHLPPYRPVADGFSSFTSKISNLEEISDWITKILIGAALVSLWRLPGDLRSVTHYVADSLGESDHTFVAAMLAFFPVTGFFATYIEYRFYLRTVYSEEEVRAVKTLTTAFDLALRPPVLVNYDGVLCVRVTDGEEELDASRPTIPARRYRSVLLEIWLQPEEPKDPRLAHAQVSIREGERREEADFEIRIDSDAMQTDKDSASLRGIYGRRSESVMLDAHFDAESTRFEEPFSYPIESSVPGNPIWIMLFQQNRLVQTIALDFDVR
jgi:hypothetical protein